MLVKRRRRVGDATQRTFHGCYVVAQSLHLMLQGTQELRHSNVGRQLFHNVGNGLGELAAVVGAEPNTGGRPPMLNNNLVQMAAARDGGWWRLQCTGWLVEETDGARRLSGPELRTSRLGASRS